MTSSGRPAPFFDVDVEVGLGYVPHGMTLARGLSLVRGAIAGMPGAGSVTVRSGRIAADVALQVEVRPSPGGCLPLDGAACGRLAALARDEARLAMRPDVSRGPRPRRPGTPDGDGPVAPER